jgi:hypothetical protein
MLPVLVVSLTGHKFRQFQHSYEFCFSICVSKFWCLATGLRLHLDATPRDRTHLVLTMELHQSALSGAPVYDICWDGPGSPQCVTLLRVCNGSEYRRILTDQTFLNPSAGTCKATYPAQMCKQYHMRQSVYRGTKLGSIRVNGIPGNHRWKWESLSFNS